MTTLYDALATEYPEAVAALRRPRWSYAAALKAADEAIAADAKPKRPAKKATTRKGAKS